MKQKRYDFAAKYHVIDGLGIKIIFFRNFARPGYTVFLFKFIFFWSVFLVIILKTMNFIYLLVFWK